MPSHPTFDLYQELELSSTATSDEITASYRRLALVHHPDKNQNSDEATAKFQRLQSAYQILKEPTSRRQYDARSSRSSSGASYASASSYNSYGYHDFDEFDFEDDGEDKDEIFEFFFNAQRQRGGGGRGGGGFGAGGFSSGGFGSGGFSFFRTGGEFFGGSRPEPPTEAEMEAARKAAEEWEAEHREQRKREYQERWDREHAKEEAAKAAKKKAEEDAQKKLDDMVMKERMRQEKIWEVRGVTTEAEKQKSCEHTEFWPKKQQKKKFKCTGCNQKRGMTGFRCPHCNILACQVCLNGFNKKRAKAAKS
ncbi:DnaJ-domain-containing protein [Acephala macrosclerotiorum]|nr:DnaJ-domain-containing protein [Acephala macrosclerotiorum]